MSLTKTKIEYLNYCWNFYTGCLHWKTGVCPVGEKCWAKKMANNPRYGGKGFEPTLHPKKLLDPLKTRKPSRIGVCFTGDLFGDWVEPNSVVDGWTAQGFGVLGTATIKETVFAVLNKCPQHQFFFLTKNPHGYTKWGSWPDNAWIGATVCNLLMYYKVIDELEKVQAKHKWLSIEPLIESLGIPGENFLKGIEWVVIGGWSGGKNPPRIEWIREIVGACDKAGVKVWLKDNLNPLFAPNECEYFSRYRDTLFRFKDFLGDGKTSWHLRQELPEVSK